MQHIHNIILILAVGVYLLYATYVSLSGFTWTEPPKVRKTNWTHFTETKMESEKMACHLPLLKPFVETIVQFFEKPKPPNCENTEHPLIFTTDLESNLIQLANISSMGYQTCCFQKLERNSSDFQTTLEKNCRRITKPKTKIPRHMEFIMVSCIRNGTSKIVDFFQFVHLKMDVEQRARRLGNSNKISKPAEAKYTKSRTVNVVILGQDGVSHMNFIRTMPLTYEYITKNLSAHGLFGYTKIGQSTFPNLGAALTGKLVEELQEICWTAWDAPLDNCPFIWKNFGAAGYRTAFGEDTVGVGIFNFKTHGFSQQPTDYYNHAFMHEFEKQLAHEQLLIGKLCYGSRLAFEVSLDLLKKMAFTMDKTRRYFQLIWTTSMTHDELNQGKLGDKPLLETLQWFKEEGYLEDTVFILMSDHGINHGDFRNTFQGQLEGRMPFLYFIFPKWFQERYRPAMSNLIRNRNKLTSPLDLYETLLDLSDLKSIENIRDRYNVNRTEMPRGISLFLPIPAERTCVDAEIPEHFCVCKVRKPVKVERNPLVEEGARNVVTYINAMFTKLPQCMALTLKKVLNAHVFYVDKANDWDESDNITDSADERLKSQSITFTIAFEVHPSQGTFEATVTRDTNGTWKVPDEISRTNLYKNQSVCVTHYNLKKFCFCGSNNIYRP